jgi:hypothetical protein
VRLDDSELGDFPAHQPKRASRPPPNAGRVLGLQETLDGGSLRVFPDRRWLNPLDTISEQKLPEGQGPELSQYRAFNWVISD